MVYYFYIYNMLEKFKLFESIRRDRDISDFVIISLYKHDKMSVRDLVNLVHKEWPSEIDRKISYYSKKNIVKSTEEIDEQIRVDLAQVMLDRTLKNPYGRKEFIIKDGKYYQLNELGKKVAESLLDKKDDNIMKFINQKKDNEEQEEDLSDKILSPSDFIKTPEKPKVYVKNPFGCKQEDGTETSALCIVGKSGSGKTTSTEEALESMGHEYLLYIPIEGEYTFSQYTGDGFEISSLGEFMMMAQNDPGKCYTIIFDECHRPITISKLNTDLLQALSSKRNRGGERFVTMDRSTKRMYTTTKDFDIPLKEKSGKILVPDNFGIVCLSSQPAVICRNADFLNRVDLVVFHQSDRGVVDLTELEKVDKSKAKDASELNSQINAMLANDEQ